MAPVRLAGTRGSAAPYSVLAVGMAAVSSAALLITFARAQGVPALAIAALRMSLAAIVVGPIALLRCRAEIRGLTAAGALSAMAAGVLLALHFAFWISSLDDTSIMSSVVFVSTSPVFVGLASVVLFRERMKMPTAVGIMASIVGAGLIAFSDAGHFGAHSIRGDLFAILGAVSASGYLLIGRRLRKRMSVTLYVGIAYVSAALVLLAIAGVTGTRLMGYSPEGYFWAALLAAGPQLLGHTSYNWALKYVSATFVTVTLLAEPIGATLLAIAFLSQVPSVLGLAGGAFILAGILLAARGESGLKELPEKVPHAM
jgi:drug/metabolite transporter (DMT)-like permease